MTSKERFLHALAGNPLDRPPVWIMRQAGRYLPEYRALKEKYSFIEMVQTPDLACEVTLQPLRRFPLDAAILFSDILVVPEALGQPYHFRDRGGIEMEFSLDSAEAVDRLDASAIETKLGYMGKALDRIRAALGDEKMVLGFGGSPWTLATYMVEGGSSKDFSKAKALFYGDRPLFDKLMGKLTQAVIDLFKLQIDHGADALQIFDSWAAACPAADYEEMSLQWIRRIIEALPEDYPIILYAKGMAHQATRLASTGASALGIDWTVELAELRAQLPQQVALQGNLDPVLLELDEHTVRSRTEALLESMRGKSGHIFNLGHGITPRALPKNVEVLVDTVVNFR